MSKNAVRAQIGTLEREGIVEFQGMFKGARRPAAIYGLSPGSDLYFSKAYPAVLSHLILVLANKLPHEEFMAVMQELGQRLASSTARPSGGPHERVQAAIKFLRALGSLAQMTEEDGKIIITGCVCPIARAVAADARACTAVEALLRELTGLPVEEHATAVSDKVVVSLLRCLSKRKWSLRVSDVSGAIGRSLITVLVP